MNILSLKPQESKKRYFDIDIFSLFQQIQEKKKSKEVKPDMSPDEIAEIVSDHLIEFVKKEFKKKEKTK